MAHAETVSHLTDEDMQKILDSLCKLANEPIKILAPHEFVFEGLVWLISSPFLLVRRVYETVTR